MFHANRVRVAIVAAAFASTAALAATPPPTPVKLYGGGATLPADAYVGGDWLSYNPANRLSDTQPTSLTFVNSHPASSDSLFNAQASDKKNPAYVQYCQSGSGTGRGIITGSKPDATAACGDYSGPTPSGFSATTARADFSASDAPLSATEIATFVANSTAPVAAVAGVQATDSTGALLWLDNSTTPATVTTTNTGVPDWATAPVTAVPAGPTYGRGEPVQFPAVAGAIAVVYHNTDQATQLNLTESQICQIFAGQITNWTQLNSTLPSKPITLVVRSDGSGTSFSWTNHLSAVCGTAQPTAVMGYSTQTTFKAGAVGGVLPTGTVASSGNGGVVASILATDGAIGYAEVSDASMRLAKAGGAGLAWATVSERPDIPAVVDPTTGKTIAKAVTFKKFDPIKNFPKSVAISPVPDMVLGANDANGRPTMVAQVPAGGVPGCLQIVDPNTYAVPPMKKGDYTQYPIFAVSYLLGYNTGNDATKLTALGNLLASPYKIPSKVKTIGANTGFAAVSVKAVNPAGNPHAIPGAKMGDLVRACLN